MVGVTDCDIRQITTSQTVDNDQQLQTEIRRKYFPAVKFRCMCSKHIRVDGCRWLLSGCECTDTSRTRLQVYI
jgi:hypothetical protein